MKCDIIKTDDRTYCRYCGQVAKGVKEQRDCPKRPRAKTRKESSEKSKPK